MKTVSTPRGLKAAVAFLALCIPLSMVQAVLMTNAPWWKLPYARIGLSAIPAVLIWVFLAVLFLKGLRVAYAFLIVFGTGWVLYALFETFRLHSAALAFYAIFTALFLVACWSWLGVELKRSFFDPRMSWFEGLPRPIPGLTCEVSGESEETSFRVCRIDREGAFVFQTSSSLGTSAVVAVAPRELVFVFRDREVRCSAVPVRAFSRAEGFRGFGFQFDQMSPDARKRLGDFVELLKGEGYV